MRNDLKTSAASDNCYCVFEHEQHRSMSSLQMFLSRGTVSTFRTRKTMREFDFHAENS